jgi:hypothetical protein
MGMSGNMAELGSFRPVIDGRTHLTWWRGRPESGQIVRLLCGVDHQVAFEEKWPDVLLTCWPCDLAPDGRRGTARPSGTGSELGQPCLAGYKPPNARPVSTHAGRVFLCPASSERLTAPSNTSLQLTNLLATLFVKSESRE